MRAADADRERARDVLRAGFAEGRLTRNQFDKRIAGVPRARTYGELSTLTQDLPTGPLPGARPPLTTNEDAIEAIRWTVLGLTAPLIGALFALLFAYDARAQIRKTGEPGRRLVIAALVINYFVIVAVITGIVLAVVFGHPSNSIGPTGGLGELCKTRKS
jgi:uncharacterized protein DUF1707